MTQQKEMSKINLESERKPDEKGKCLNLVMWSLQGKPFEVQVREVLGLFPGRAPKVLWPSSETIPKQENMQECVY